MDRILKPHTIVPESLYVERSGDKEISNIIEDMGRPGYVLVSRQMGKTNLLLHSKNKFEKEGNVCVYIDLSNSFNNIRECFRNIIDTAIETNLHYFTDFLQNLNTSRTNTQHLPSHKEHLIELNELLKALNGKKLIILLDEIDGLTKVDYSDEIFSLIRSNYFASRVNYKTFFNLTYLLSGVAEPREIIKNQKISPFNIGQKIYLEDFTFTEFEEFLHKSQLELNFEIKNRIFYWTNGNPRLTWDVCSFVEEHQLLNSNEVTVELIDSIVKKEYLITFDKPPIDNIRELVESDKDLQNALVEIHYKKNDKISDRIKSKLYLSGIINYNNISFGIKNKIIENSLSESWLKSLEVGLASSPFSQAIEFYQKGKYLEALDELEKLMNTDGVEDDPEIDTYYFIMAKSAFQMEKFEKAETYLIKCGFEKDDDPKSYYRKLHLKGMINYHQGRSSKCLEILKEIINSNRIDDTYVLALLNYGAVTLGNGKNSSKNEAIKVFENIIDEEKSSKLKVSKTLKDKLQSYAYYYLSQIKVVEGKSQDALSLLEKSFSLNNDLINPQIALNHFYISKSKSRSKIIIKKAINLINTKLLAPEPINKEYPLNFSIEDLQRLLAIVYVEYEPEIYKQIEDKISLVNESNIGEIIFNYIDSYLYKNNKEDALRYANSIYDREMKLNDTLSEGFQINILRFLLMFTNVNNSNYNELLDKYLNYHNSNNEIKIEDLNVFVSNIFVNIKEGNIAKATELLTLINSKFKDVSDALKLDYLLIYNLELTLLGDLKMFDAGIGVAQKILKLASSDKYKNSKGSLLGKKGLEIVINNAKNYLGLPSI